MLRLKVFVEVCGSEKVPVDEKVLEFVGAGVRVRLRDDASVGDQDIVFSEEKLVVLEGDKLEYVGVFRVAEPDRDFELECDHDTVAFEWVTVKPLLVKVRRVFEIVDVPRD